MPTNTTTVKEPEQVECECGHTVPTNEAVSLPEVGEYCRSCHTPIPLRNWDDVIRTSKIRHRTGETSHYQTWLIGLDRVGRALYHDEREKQILVVVPKYHPDFRKDVDGGERPIRKRRPPRAPSIGEIVNAPDNGVLAVVDHFKTQSGSFSKKELSEWVVGRAVEEEWDAISESMLEYIRRNTEKYDKDAYVDDAFPVEKGREVLERYADD